MIILRWLPWLEVSIGFSHGDGPSVSPGFGLWLIKYAFCLFYFGDGPFISRLFKAGDIRDGTGWYCFGMFRGKKNGDGKGRDGTEKKSNKKNPGWDGTGRWG